MNRRELLKALGIGVPGIAHAQQAFHAASLATMVFQTTKTTGFNPSFTKTGSTLYWKWPDGTYTSSNAPSKNLAAGTKTVRVQSQDGFKAVTVVNIAVQQLTGALPSFAACTALTFFQCYSNSFSGALPSFAACTALTTFYCYSNSFSGALPSFAACTALTTFGCFGNGFTGILPSFATCTALVTFDCDTNAFTGALPSFAACTALKDFECYTNGFTGALPSFAACTALKTFYCFGNGFTGILPSFATCTALVTFYCGDTGARNMFSDVVAGSFATQKSLSTAHFTANAFSAAAVNQILADFVASLGISGRVVCNVNLSGGTNAAPTGQGILDRATLTAAGWTVTTT